MVWSSVGPAVFVTTPNCVAFSLTVLQLIGGQLHGGVRDELFWSFVLAILFVWQKHKGKTATQIQSDARHFGIYEYYTVVTA